MSPRKLPNELERMIFLLVPYPTAHICLGVAKRVRLWLEPKLYNAVCLSTDQRAESFLESVLHRPDFAQATVKVLCLNVSVLQGHAADILSICRGVKALNMRFPCHLKGENPILRPLDGLTCVETLSVDLSSIFNTQRIYLPNIKIFHRVTHLHLANAWASWYPALSAIGLECLNQITHLSLLFSTIRTQAGPLRMILDHKNLVVLVLWKRSSTTVSEAVEYLTKENLDDKRVLVLNDKWFIHHMLNEGFWVGAESVVKSREVSETGLSHDNTETLSARLVEHTQILNFHSADAQLIATDIESSESGEESDWESRDSDEESVDELDDGL